MKKPVAWLARLLLILAAAVPACMYLLAGVYYPPLFWIAAVWVVWARLRRRGGLWTHGTARLASWFSDLQRRGMLASSGLLLGCVDCADRPSPFQAVRLLLDPRIASEVACQAALSAIYRRRRAAERMIRLKHFCHGLVVAPPGKGKSVSFLIPNLLSYLGSLVCVDIKGELWTLTAAARQWLGHRVFVLDPGGLCRDPQSGRRVTSDGFNPFDFIDAEKPDFLTKCRDLANMLVVRPIGDEREPHWNDAAELILCAFIAWVAAVEHRPHLRNLTTVRLLVSSKKNYLIAISAMQRVQGFGGVVATLGRLLQWFMDRELGSVMTTVQRHTAWIDDPQAAACLSHTTFNPRLLRTGKVTAYFVLGHDKVTIWQGLMRLWLGCTMRIATEGPPTEVNPVTFFVDEAGHIGHMRALQDGITLMRGMGVRIWLFFQSLGQLRAVYGTYADIILSSTDAQMYFAVNDITTAEPLSKRIGECTVEDLTESGGTSESWSTSSTGREPSSGNRSSNRNWSRAPIGRPLMRLEEIMTLPEWVALIFIGGMPCILARLVRYYEEKSFMNGGKGDRSRLGLGTLAASAAVLLASLVLTGVTTAVLAGSLPMAASAPSVPVAGSNAPQARRQSEFLRTPPTWPPPSRYPLRSRGTVNRSGYQRYGYPLPAQRNRYGF